MMINHHDDNFMMYMISIQWKLHKWSQVKKFLTKWRANFEETGKSRVENWKIQHWGHFQAVCEKSGTSTPSFWSNVVKQSGCHTNTLQAGHRSSCFDFCLENMQTAFFQSKQDLLSVFFRFLRQILSFVRNFWSVAIFWKILKI